MKKKFNFWVFHVSDLYRPNSVPNDPSHVHFKYEGDQVKETKCTGESDEVRHCRRHPVYVVTESPLSWWFICNRLKKRRKPRVKLVTLQLC